MFCRAIFWQFIRGGRFVKKHPYTLIFQKHFYLCRRLAQNLALFGVLSDNLSREQTPFLVLTNCHFRPDQTIYLVHLLAYSRGRGVASLALRAERLKT